MASLVREAIADSLQPPRRDDRQQDYPLTGLVGIARGEPLPDGRAVSEHHDEVLEEAYSEGWFRSPDSSLPADIEG